MDAKTEKRAPVKLILSTALVSSLTFERWPTKWSNTRILKTEPTPAHVKDWVVRDLKDEGFGVRISKTRKSYFVQRKTGGSTSERFKLSEQRDQSKARKEAKDWLNLMAHWKNPLAEKRKHARDRENARALTDNTFGVVYQAFLDQGIKDVAHMRLKNSSLVDRRKLLRWLGDTELWKTPLAEVTDGLVEETFAGLFAQATRARQARQKEEPRPRKRGGGPGADVATAHKCITHCATAWNQAIGAKVAANPFSAWRNKNRKTLPKVERRQTRLPTRKEQGMLWLKGLEALRHDDRFHVVVVADYVMAILLWGSRKTETALIRWMDIDFEEQWACFSADTTKAGKDHYVPLTPWSIELLMRRRSHNVAAGHPTGRTDLVFPHPNTKKAHLTDYRYVATLLKECSAMPEREGLPAQPGLLIGLHDLRRTLAGELFGSSKDVGTVAFALGHSSGQDVTMGYIERQEALDGLRELYVARERRLRQLIGLEDTIGPRSTTDAQKAVLAAVASLLKQGGIAPEELAQHLAQK